ncbi:hypothetical protein VHEMI00231 [[Torrubiella] hemipterigena]|uniref:Uncharacterized protein n=1 Tax=[Torrubiella] hemipterigena TaxID=1531966 RepID=A0A0A1T3W8_9HYPO|nr:hypothetical protein VHEMI00231 [[Torrubiella] hemipterigena]
MGLWQKMQAKKQGPPISDEDLLKYTGKTREEFEEFKKDTPGVAGNQLAGKLAMGGTSGLAGAATSGGYGGWGPGAGENGPNRGMKFPPEKTAKKLEDDE